MNPMMIPSLLRCGCILLATGCCLTAADVPAQANSNLPEAVASPTPRGETYFVRSRANTNSTGDGTLGNPHTKLASAFAQARSNDTVRVASGLYPDEAAALTVLAGVRVEAGWTADFSQRTTNANPKLEVREDGRAYAQGEAQPFNGWAATLESLPTRANKDLGFSVLTPYHNGRMEGTRWFFYPGGARDQEKLYKDGNPQEVLAYFSSGAKKYQAQLNAQDQMHGAHTRWYPDGVVHARTLHAGGQFHGEAREYSEDGALKAHYTWERGVIVKIHFETPAQIEHRHEKYGKVAWEK